MEEEETAALGACLDCGEIVDEALGRTFTFGENGILCWRCAERRGGEYDASEDRWLAAPRVADLVKRHFIEI